MTEQAKKFIPRPFRRVEIQRKNQGTRHTSGREKHTNRFFTGTGKIWDYSAIHIPKRKKIKGWQVENRKYRKIS
jgi:hypothetical protein